MLEKARIHIRKLSVNEFDELIMDNFEDLDDTDSNNSHSADDKIDTKFEFAYFLENSTDSSNNI